MNPNYPAVAARAWHRCEYCLAPESIFNFRFEVEHIIPISRGGSVSLDNLALACRACNLQKSDHIHWNVTSDKISAPLFNPRQNEWRLTFEVNIETGEIKGITNIGIATVNCLRMNSLAQRIARVHWIRLGLFP